MQPFTISCLTCGTKLKVSDESLIGEILMCAKCHSMVLVEPPADAPAVASITLTPDGPQSPEPPVADESAAAAAAAIPIPPPEVSAAATAAPPAVTAVPSDAPPSASLTDVQPATATATAVGSLAMPAAPSTPWQKWLVYGASSSAGVVFVVSAWLFWKARQVETTAPPTPVASVVQPAKRSNPPTQVSEADDTGHAELVVAEPPRDSRSPDPVDPAADPLAPPAPEEAAAGPHENQSDPPAPTDPLLIAEADPAPNIPDENEPTTTPTPATPDELPFGPVPPVEYPIPDPHPDVAGRLGLRVAAIELTGDTANGEVLTRVTSMLSQMTAVPIHLDAVALKRIGKSGDSPVRLKMENATVAELLGAMLDAWGLAAVPTGDHVLVTVPQPGAETVVFERRYPFNDLAAGQVELREIADLIRHSVAPDTWSTRGGAGAISISGANMRITQSPLAHHQILLLCEKLRVARGLQPKSIYFRSDPAALPLDSRSLLAASELAVRTDFSTSQQVPLSAYALSLQYRSGIEVAVDELALYRGGLSPEILVGYDGPEKPLAEVLAEVLGTINLSYRIIDAKTIQITTPKEMARTPEIEFFQLANLPASGVEALLTRIKANVVPAYWKAAGDNAHLDFDAPSKCLIVRASQPIQQKLQSALIDWGLVGRVTN